MKRLQMLQDLIGTKPILCHKIPEVFVKVLKVYRIFDTEVYSFVLNYLGFVIHTVILSVQQLQLFHVKI